MSDFPVLISNEVCACGASIDPLVALSSVWVEHTVGSNAPQSLAVFFELALQRLQLIVTLLAQLEAVKVVQQLLLLLQT